MEQENLTEAEIRARILSIDEKIEEELAKRDADMSVVEDYFLQIRNLSGNTHKKDASELDAGLQAIYMKAARRKKKPIWGHIGKRVAGIAATLLIVFGCSMTVSAVREPIVSFCMNTYEKFTEFFFDASDIEKAPSTIETVYTLGYVPEGYEISSELVERYRANFVWKNRNGDPIEFKQYTLDGILHIDHEQSDIHLIEENGIYIYFKEAYGLKTYYWSTNEYRFCLKITDDNVATEDGMELIRSVMKYN